jgi:hypothetical protein
MEEKELEANEGVEEKLEYEGVDKEEVKEGVEEKEKEGVEDKEEPNAGVENMELPKEDTVLTRGE